MRPRAAPSRAVSPLLLLLPLLAGVIASASAADVPRTGFPSDADTGTVASVRERQRLPSIGGVHVRRHEPSGTELGRSRVALSPRGLRVRRLGGTDTLEIIEDFVAGRVWFVDRRRRVVHELPSAHAPTDDGVAAIAPPRDGATADDAPRSGFLGTEPCAGGSSRADGSGRWRGRRVAMHLCTDANGAAVALELVDRTHDIVVLRRTPDGHVDELLDIRSRRFSDDHFSPPSRFRAVDERELFHGAVPIAAFVEADGTPR